MPESVKCGEMRGHVVVPLRPSSSYAMSYPKQYTNFGEVKYHKLVVEADGVLRVSFQRGQVNAWIEPMWREMDAILRFVARDGDVNAIVLSGENRCFTAGLDLSSDGLNAAMAPGGDDPARKAMFMVPWLQEFQDAISMLEKCQKPVVAAIHNVAYGLAIDILSAVDIRYAAEDVRFSIKEVDAGLAADIGTLQRFPKIVSNDSWTRELALTGREFDAQEALQFGFISKIVPGGKEGVLREAIKTASIMASKSPVALRNTKHLLVHSRDHSVQEGLNYTAVLNGSGLQSHEIPEAVSEAFIAW